VKLSDDSFKLKSADAGGYFARALRAIGQDLAELIPQLVEIEYRGDSFEVAVRCDRKRFEKKYPTDPKSGLKGTLHKLANYRLDKPSDDELLTSFTQSYGAEDIRRLDEIGRHRRSQVGKTPDINTLGEALRTIGRIVDADNGQLVRIFRDQRRIAFEYTDKGGATRKTEMTRTELYKAQQSFYGKRAGSQSLDTWKGHN
jgi:hypothetical protein